MDAARDAVQHFRLKETEKEGRSVSTDERLRDQYTIAKTQDNLDETSRNAARQQALQAMSAGLGTGRGSPAPIPERDTTPARERAIGGDSPRNMPPTPRPEAGRASFAVQDSGLTPANHQAAERAMNSLPAHHQKEVNKAVTKLQQNHATMAPEHTQSAATRSPAQGQASQETNVFDKFGGRATDRSVSDQMQQLREKEGPER